MQDSTASGRSPEQEAITLDGTPRAVSPPGYTLLEEVGRGGMGVVYKAHDLSLNRVVALKTILAGAHANAEQRGRFLREAESIARLRHPNIVQVFEVGEHNGLPFFSLEFCEGGTLESRLAGIPLSPHEAASLVAALAEAVHAAHAAGIVHRDLKPANVLLREPLLPKITDFGLAKWMEQGGQTQSGAVVGTPQYMAPEQARGHSKDVGPAADIYALGAILYECLTGRPPFRAATAAETLVQVLADEPVPPARLNRQVPRDLQTVCLKCLEKQPQRRYASARGLAEDLGRFLEGRPVGVRPIGRVERAWRWCRRNPAVAGLLAAVILALTAGVVVSSLLAVEATRSAEDARNSEQRAREAEAAATTRALSEARLREYAESQAALAREREATLRLAHAYLFGGQLSRAASQLLDPLLGAEILHDCAGCPVELRDPAWRYQERRTSRWCALTLAGHRGGASAVVFSPDGRTLASSGADGVIRLWSLPEGRARELRGHRGPVHALAYSPDGKRLASAGNDTSFRLWDTATGTTLLTLKLRDTAVRAVAFSRDGTTLATGDGNFFTAGEVVLWDLAQRKPRATLKGHDQLRALDFSPDGRLLASADDNGNVKLWDLATAKEKVSRPGALSAVATLRFTPDGETLVAAGDGGLELLSPRTLRSQRTLDTPLPGIRSLAVSPDGTRWAVGARSLGVAPPMVLYDPVAGRPDVFLRGHRSAVEGLAFSPDGRWLASAGEDGRVFVWSTGWGGLSPFPRDDTLVQTVAFSPDGSHLAWGTGTEVKFGQLATGRVLRFEAHDSSVVALAFRPDGRLLASGDSGGAVRLWEQQTGQEQGRFEAHSRELRALAFSPDGAVLASAGTSASRGGEVTLWDVASRTVRTRLTAHSGEAGCVVFSLDGKVLATGGAGPKKVGEVKLWDAASGTELASLVGHGDAVHAIAFSHDGAWLASAGEDGRIRVWDVARRRERGVLEGHQKAVRGLAFFPLSAHGGRGGLVSAAIDGTFRFWDLLTFQERTQEMDDGPLLGLALSPNGRLLATPGGFACAVRLYDLGLGPDRVEMRSDLGAVRAVVFSPDGGRVVARAEKGDAVWDLASGQRLREAEPPAQTVDGPLSPDGRWRVSVDGATIVLTEASPVPSPFAIVAPGRPDLLRHQGRADQAEKERRWFAAAFHLERLIRERPWDGSLHLRRGRALAEAERHDEAAVAFLQGYFVNPQAKLPAIPE